MRFESFGTSHKGLVRQINEDAYLASQQDGLFLVADGMGGLSRGDLASQIVVDSVLRFIRDSRAEDITWPIKPKLGYSLEENRFLAALHMANWGVYSEYLKDTQKTPMGSTLVGLLVDGESLVIGNIGDSRAYLIRDGALLQITEDHSLVMDEVRKGTMTRSEARKHPHKHVINRALGISESAQVDISSLEAQGKDLFLLCSDGLSDMLSDEDILMIVQPHMDAPLSALGDELLRAANKRGGKDNITLVLLRFFEETG